MVAARRNSPLVVGVGEGENFLASDVSAFIEHTREAIELGQDQVVTITPTAVEVITFAGEPATVRPYHVSWDLSAAEKGGFDWFMRKEIYDQPKAVADTLLGRHDASGALRLDEIRIAAEELRAIDKIIVIACGNVLLRGHGGEVRDRALDPDPVRGGAGQRVPLPRSDRRSSTLVVSISQSGETADTLMATGTPGSRRPRCWPSATPTDRPSRASPTRSSTPTPARKIGVASTKGFLTQLVACYLLGLYLAQVGERSSATRSPR